MGVGAGLSMHVVVVQKFTFAISSPDEFLLFYWNLTFVPDKVVGWCRDGYFLAIFCVLYFFSEPRAARFRPAL